MLHMNNVFEEVFHVLCFSIRYAHNKNEILLVLEVLVAYINSVVVSRLMTG